MQPQTDPAAVVYFRATFHAEDLYTLLGDVQQSPAKKSFTDNGIHLTSYGYWQAAAVMEHGLGWETPELLPLPEPLPDPP